LVSVLWLAFVLAVATVDGVSCSWAEYFIIFTVFWTMYWAYVSIEISVFFNTKIWFLASIFINTAWAVDVVWWANGGTVRGIWAVFSLVISCSVFTGGGFFTSKRSFFCWAQYLFWWAGVWASMRIGLSWAVNSVGIFSFGMADILSLTSLVDIPIVINGTVAFDFPVSTFNGASSRTHTVWGKIIRLLWYANIVFFTAVMSDVSLTKVLGIITDKLALLEITEFSSIVDLLSLTVIWVRTAIVWVIRLFACDLVVFACFYTETWTDFVVHVLSFRFTSWLDGTAVGIFSSWTANFSFFVTIAFADNGTEFTIVTWNWASTFVRNTNFVLVTEMENESVWAYSSWALSTFDFVFSTYVVL